jgi:hypothetical protein
LKWKLNLPRPGQRGRSAAEVRETMIILAMTQLTSWIGIVSFVICVALIFHAVFPWSSTNRERVEPQWWSLCVRFVLECASLFLWLAYGLPLLAWAFWIGDNEHWFYHYAWIFAVLISVSASAVATARVSRRGATARYLRLHLWLPLGLVLSFGATVGYESVRTIEGTTPDSAAQEVFDRLAARMDQPVKFVEHVGRLAHGLDAERCRSFWILGPNEPRGRFSICRHKWYGWQFAYSEIFPPSVDELNRAKKWLSGSTNRDGAILILQSVIANYPNTSAETEARELLESIGEPVAPR